MCGEATIKLAELSPDETTFKTVLSKGKDKTVYV